MSWKSRTTKGSPSADNYSAYPSFTYQSAFLSSQTKQTSPSPFTTTLSSYLILLTVAFARSSLSFRLFSLIMAFAWVEGFYAFGLSWFSLSRGFFSFGNWYSEEEITAAKRDAKCYKVGFDSTDRLSKHWRNDSGVVGFLFSLEITRISISVHTFYRLISILEAILSLRSYKFL